MTLLERVEGATGPDRDLDSMIWCEVANNTGIVFPDEKPGAPKIADHIKPYTSSLDAVLALVEEKLPGWRPGIIREGRAEWSAFIFSPKATDPKDHFAPTPALALLKALLTALEAGDG